MRVEQGETHGDCGLDGCIHRSRVRGAPQEATHQVQGLADPSPPPPAQRLSAMFMLVWVAREHVPDVRIKEHTRRPEASSTSRPYSNANPPTLQQDSEVTYFRYGAETGLLPPETKTSSLQEERHHSDGFASPFAADRPYSNATIGINKIRDEFKSTQSLTFDRSPSKPKFSPNTPTKAERD